MNLTELKAFLAKLGVSPKKGLSQNFLIDRNIVAKIIEEARVERGDYILEIGPGPGALTEGLLKKGAEIVAVELDSLFARELKRLPITVYNEDILKFPFEKLTKRGKVVANLPYHITAPILTRLVSRRDLFSTVTVMVQEEVARRLMAPPKTKDYGSLSIYLQFYSTIHYAFPVSRSCFYPAPHVDSAIVTLTLKEPPKLPNEEDFFAFVRLAFEQRRKMLKKRLIPEFGVEQVVKAFDAIEIDPKVRPEELSLEKFISLFCQLNGVYTPRNWNLEC